MTETPEYLVALFRSVSHVIQSERLLMEQKIPHKIIPVPKNISSDCGVCIRFLPGEMDAIVRALDGKTEILEIRPLV